MFLRANRRFKDGKEHRYWSIVESKRCAGGKVVQRPVLYLGEINDCQREAWCRVVDAFDEDARRHTQLALFPADRSVPDHARDHGVQVRLDAMKLHAPRQWGACWLACHLYEETRARSLLGRSPGGLARGHELAGHRADVGVLSADRSRQRVAAAPAVVQPERDGRCAGADYSLVEKNALYRCLDKLLEHKQDLFSHLRQRWQDLFGAQFEVLLYDLTSTYFEAAPPRNETDKRRYGYSRDKRGDCVQVVIALVVTPEGFPLAYEVLAGNTADNTTLRDFLAKIEAQHGKAQRIWVMDRGIPTEAVLAEMRQADPPVHYLVGTPKGRLSKLEKALLDKPWQSVRQGVDVKLLAEDQELYVLARSEQRVHKERAMRRRKLKWLWARLKELAAIKKIKRQDLLMKLGGARAKAPAAWRLIDLEVAPRGASFTYALNRSKLRHVRRREGRYLLRSNLAGRQPAELWQFYIQLTEIEAAFKNLKHDLQLRPIFHQLEQRIEAHIFTAFIAYCLHVTLRARLRGLAGGLTPRAVLDKFADIKMLDVHFPTTDGRTLVLTRHTEPNADQKILLHQLKLDLPPQPPPKISAPPTSAS